MNLRESDGTLKCSDQGTRLTVTTPTLSTSGTLGGGLGYCEIAKGEITPNEATHLVGLLQYEGSHSFMRAMRESPLVRSLPHYSDEALLRTVLGLTLVQRYAEDLAAIVANYGLYSRGLDLSNVELDDGGVPPAAPQRTWLSTDSEGKTTVQFPVVGGSRN